MADPAPHRHTVRVYYEDTDAGGIVYHSNYLKFAERARTELLRTVGLEHRELMTAHGAGFAVRRCAIDFRKPALLDDLLEIETRMVRRRGASVEMRQIIRRAADPLVEIDIHVALIDGRGRPMRLPEPLVRALDAPGPA
jgi:acyl-CoA thioester hydrolase